VRVKRSKRDDVAADPAIGPQQNGNEPVERFGGAPGEQLPPPVGADPSQRTNPLSREGGVEASAFLAAAVSG